MDHWEPMETAPKDGRRILLRVRHLNWHYAGEHDREKWQEDVIAEWVNHNGGGWMWKGIFGEVVGWRALVKSEFPELKG